MTNTIGVLGAGQMGNGIAHVLAQHEYQVRLYDISPAQIEKALKTIETNLGRQAQKGIIPADAVPSILAQIKVAKDLTEFADCELVVEAVTENEPLKLDMFRKLDEVVNKDAVLASNTSSIPITKIASVTKRARQGDRHAFHEPGAGHEAGGGDPRTRHQRRNVPDRGRTGGKTRKRRWPSPRIIPASSSTAC